MGKFRFVHAADIHLGSFLHMDGMEVHPRLQELSRTAAYRALDQICHIAFQSKSRFLLLVGDIYDREARSVRANRYFVESCKRLQKQNIQVFITAGNHDPIKEYGELFQLPDNVHIFRADQPEMVLVKGEDGEPLAAVSGQSYGGSRENSPLHQHYPVSRDRIFRIAMLHTQLESPKSYYIPASLSDLTGHSGFDYWALGHIHQPRILNEANPVVAYPGTPQGRDFSEQGPRGCWLVEVDDVKGINMEYEVTSPVVYRNLFVDIGCSELRDVDNLDQLEEYLISQAHKTIQEEINRHNSEVCLEGCIIRWEIAGRGRLHHYLSDDPQGCEQEIIQALRDALSSQTPFLWTDSVILRTSNPIDDDMQSHNPLLQELMDQTILSLREDRELREKLISTLGQAWTTNMDYEDQDDESLPLDQHTFESIVEDAVRLIQEGLAEGGDG